MSISIGLISDIHSNLEALQAIVDLFDRLEVESMYCLGDITGYGPDPEACIEIMQKRRIPAVLGNHDAAAVGLLPPDPFPLPAVEVHRWTRDQLSAGDKEYLKNLPRRRELSWGLLLHGSPHRPLWEYVRDPRSAFRVFRANRASNFFVGHTHLPLLFYSEKMQVKTVPVRVGKKNRKDPDLPASFHFEFKERRRYLCNPGSVGQPRDGDPRASCAVLSGNNGQLMDITWYRVNYDAEKTLSKIQNKGLPAVFGRRLLLGD